MSDAFALLAVPVCGLGRVRADPRLSRRSRAAARTIVFADLALAQLSALGATVAFRAGYRPTSPAGFGYALLFTGVGAALLTLTRGLARFVSQRGVRRHPLRRGDGGDHLVVDRSPQGAEHVKTILLWQHP